jgi:hypothetical protein
LPVDLAESDVPTVIDANELLWAARVLVSLVRVHRNIIPAVRERKAGRGDPGSYADVPDFDPREQRWTVGRQCAACRQAIPPIPFSAHQLLAKLLVPEGETAPRPPRARPNRKRKPLLHAA